MQPYSCQTLRCLSVWFSFYTDACVHSHPADRGSHINSAEEGRKKVIEEEREAEIKADKGGNVTYCSVGFTAAELGERPVMCRRACRHKAPVFADAGGPSRLKPRCFDVLHSSMSAVGADRRAPPEGRAAGRHTGRARAKAVAAM